MDVIFTSYTCATLMTLVCVGVDLAEDKPFLTLQTSDNQGILERSLD